MIRPAKLPIALVGVIAVLGGTVAAAATQVESRITIRNTRPLYHGQVRSAEASCLASRKVILFRRAAGPDQRIGVDNGTSQSGAWKVWVGPTNLHSGDRFYAKTPSHRPPLAAGNVRCLRAKSATVDFGD